MSVKQILLGTSNPSRADFFARQLEGYGVSFLLLRDLGIEALPDEAGRSPLENAMAKAAYYGRFHDYVISGDSALYIRELPADDPRQPGLTVRRRPDGSSMSDEEMAAHYSALARDMGGRMTCWYRNGYAVCCRGEVSGFMDPEPVSDLYTFWMVDKPRPGYTPGWPLDSLSVWPATGKYFVESRATHLDAAGKVLEGNHRAEILAFYAEKLGLERRETPRSVD